ncbi:hypothetical protein ACFZBM_37300 [Streptomyces lavendulae]|uniref:Uncharacterized protein n=1 Tax=Streptomyces lavendulae subsp. lavendulae TaxID=58340 RepID=A0A2K8PEV3_STRLA|nr:hypothetical protein [Streptomyces lavendulae]ATZ25261.1 hypothetical protein SLAV_17055 [Streptomyces lavendulae subsp. lavendulae]QUQ55091.1 hypothetical protein SLLC_15120 [Streptomyces lavendulae subsp. lavendulae]
MLIRDEKDAPRDRTRYALTILRRFAPLAWYRSPVERHEFGYLQVAHLGWRFTEPHDEFRPVFEETVRDAPLLLDWRFEVKRNWLILPVRLTEETARCGDNFSEAQSRLLEDQEFCLATSAGLELILQALDAAAPPAPTTPETL